MDVNFFNGVKNKKSFIKTPQLFKEIILVEILTIWLKETETVQNERVFDICTFTVRK